MLLLAVGAVAGQHLPALVAAAFTPPDTPRRRAGELSPVWGVLEKCQRLRREPAAPGEMRVQRAGLDDLARVHPVARVEGGLQLAERADQVRSEHLRQQFAARLAVAVLAGQGAV